MNHRWKDNKCIHCGISRIKKYWRQLMSVMNHPPWEAWRSGTDWYYYNKSKQDGTFNRPECKNHKQ